MYIEDCAKKAIFGSFDRNKLPNNLNDYNCELYIEEYSQGPNSEEVKYFKFTPKYGVKADPFTINIDSIAPNKNLIYFYRLDQKESERGNQAKIVIGNKMQIKMLTTVNQPPKKEVNLELLPEPDSGGQLNLAELDDMMVGGNNLQLYDSVEEEYDSNDSKCVEPPEGVKGNIKNELIHYFHIQENRFSRIKDIKQYLRDRGHKISENALKVMLGEVCRTNLPDKKVGFVLKEHFFQKEEFVLKNPRKKVKEQ